MSWMDRFRRTPGTKMSRPKGDTLRTGSTRVRASDSVDLDHLHSPRPTALDGLLSDEWRRRAAQALRQLRAGDRRVVVGRVVASLSFGELAARTGHPSADAARKATTRALGRLRQHLTD